MFDPTIPPTFPSVINMAMPTARLNAGARLFPTHDTVPIIDAYNPMEITNKKK